MTLLLNNGRLKGCTRRLPFVNLLNANRDSTNHTKLVKSRFLTDKTDKKIKTAQYFQQKYHRGDSPLVAHYSAEVSPG